MFTIAIFAAPAILVLVSESPLIFTFGKSLSFLIAVVLSIIISAAIAIPLLPNYGNALVCVSCFLLQLELCILILPCDGYYGLAILAVLLLIVVVALLQPMLQHAVKKCVLSPYDGDTSARSDHNQEDDVDDQHLDNLFLLPQGLATCGGLLLTKVFTSYIAGPVNAVRFLFFCTIVLCLYTAAAIIVRAVSRPHAICLCILSVALLVSTVIAASIPAVPSATQGARHKL